MNTNNNYPIYRGEDEPKSKEVIWIHHFKYKDLSSPIVAQVYSQGKWQDIKGGQPSSSAVEGVGVKSIQNISKEEFDALETKDPETLYIVKNDPTNGHEWVDIGMVDDDGYHIVWATKNIGAENPWDTGKYFAWGDTVGYYANEGHEFNNENTPYWDSENEEYTKYNEEDGLAKLQPEDDAAHVQWNGLWEMVDSDKLDFMWIEDLELIMDDTCILVKSNNGKNIIFNLSGFIVNLDPPIRDCAFSLVKNGADYNSSYYYIDNIFNHTIESNSRCIGYPIRPIIRVKDLSELDPTYDIYLGEDKIVDNDKQDSNMTNILWADLVALRDNSKLIPGMWYRITDYKTTTLQTNTRSANHQFDIIVLATDVNKLSENAKAIKHDNRYNVTFTDGITKECYVYYENTYNFVDCNTLLGGSGILPNEFEINEEEKTINLHHNSDYLDEGELRYDYFKDCSLEAWELKYCLNNDTSRFVWASSENGINSNNINIVKPEYDSLPNNFKHVIKNEGFEYSDKDCGFFINSDISETITYGFSHDSGVSISTDYVVIIPSNTIINSNSKIVFCDVRDGGTQTPLKAGEINETYIEEKGKGVIYYMKDEWNNDCPYDFKNIQFKRYYVEGSGQFDSKYVGIKSLNGETLPYNYDIVDEDNYIWMYTFTGQKAEWNEDDEYIEEPGDITSSSEIFDLSIVNMSNFYDENNDACGCCNNVLKPAFNYPNSLNQYILNNTVFTGWFVNVNTLPNDYEEMYADMIYQMMSVPSANIFGINAIDNTFGNNCRYNTFGNECYYNTFGNDCYNNTFGNNCWYNTFGNNIGGNTFGNNFQNNTFGNDCYNNTFGNNFQKNTFGNNIEESQFGDGVQYFSIIKSASTTAPAASNTQSFVRWLIVENGVRYVNAYCTGTTSSSNYCQNIKIGLGVKGTSQSDMLPIDITSQIGATASVTYQPANSQVINV